MVQEKESSRFSRKLINLFAAMADGSPHFPSVLHKEGYKVHSIEKTFTALPGTRKVNPEIILCSDQLAHTLVIEAKSGANLSSEQLARYASLTEEALRDSAFTSKSSAKSHNVLIIGKDSYKKRLLAGSAVHPSKERVIAVVLDDQSSKVETDFLQFDVVENSTDSVQLGIQLVENQFIPASLNGAFGALLPVNWDVVPVNYLPVDHEAEDWEFAERLIPELISRIQGGDASAKLDELGLAMIGLWKLFEGAYKRVMKGRLERVLKLAAQTRFSAYLSFGERGLPRNEVRFKTPANLIGKPGSLRTSLTRQARLFLEDLNSPQIAIVFDPNDIKLD